MDTIIYITLAGSVSLLLYLAANGFLYRRIAGETTAAGTPWPADIPDIVGKPKESDSQLLPKETGESQLEIFDRARTNFDSESSENGSTIEILPEEPEEDDEPDAIEPHKWSRIYQVSGLAKGVTFDQVDALYQTSDNGPSLTGAELAEMMELEMERAVDRINSYFNEPQSPE